MLGLLMDLLLPLLLALSLSNCAVGPTGDDHRLGYQDLGRSNSVEQEDKPYVLLISIDGYRYDYTDKFKPKNLLRFRNEGSFASSLRPTYPSKTFPNHYSIVTGLHAGNHGVVTNRFYSPKTKTIFQLSDRDTVVDGRYYGGIPIWVVAEKQGMLTASYFWPGSEAEIKGVRPNYSYEYNHNTPHQQRIDQVMRWFQLPKKRRPHFVTLYFSDVDSAGHKYGTDSKELSLAVDKVDQSLGGLFSQLKQLPFKVNVIIVSDHGMTNVLEKKVEYLDNFLTDSDKKGLKFVDRGSQMFVYKNSESDFSKKQLEKIYNKLKFDTMGVRFRVYKKNELPKKYHYSSHINIGELVIVTKPPYTVCLEKKTCRFSRGVHGYDPYEVKSMHGILYVKGPNFKSGHRLSTLSNVHIYPALHEIFGLSVLGQHDGEIDKLSPVLR